MSYMSTNWTAVKFTIWMSLTAAVCTAIRSTFQTTFYATIGTTVSPAYQLSKHAALL